MSERKILVIVEGAKTDFNLMKRLLKIYGISDNHQIVSYDTNIYTLYNQLPENEEEYEDIDLQQILKEREKDERKIALLNERYTDILLIFDLDPQAPDFSPDKIRKMANYFTESTNMGKLYLNYPMVESFYHMKNIPDDDYKNYIVPLEILRKRQYKQLVHGLCRNGDYNKFAVSKEECNIVIKQNIEKARMLTQKDEDIPDGIDVLDEQLSLLKNENAVSVLCTCVFYIAEYNPGMID